jgi:recombination protein RecT
MSSVLEKLNAPAAQKPQTLPAMLKQYQPRFKAIAPAGVDVSRFSAALMADVRSNAKLAECNPITVIGAFIRATQLGLEPGGQLGQAYFVPFKGECQLVIGYRGMIELAYRSGKVASITARTVHTNDLFEWELGTDERITHKPAAGDRGSLVAVYAMAKLTTGGIHFEVLDLAEIEKAKRASKSSGFGPWKDHFEEMAKKTAIRRLFKYLPVGTELSRAVAIDEKAETGTQRNDIEAELVLEGEFQAAGGGSDG